MFLDRLAEGGMITPPLPTLPAHVVSVSQCTRATGRKPSDP
jgi:hypothetical protein